MYEKGDETRRKERKVKVKEIKKREKKYESEGRKVTETRDTE